MAHGPITAGTFVAGNNNAQTPTNPTHVSGDTLLCIAVIRSTTATLSVSGAGWGAADGITNPISLNGARLYIFQNEADSGSEANPTVTPSGGANGVTVTAGVLRLEGRDPDANFSIGTVSSNAVSTSIIAFGQNSPTIEYGNAILAIGHILDDYTTAPGALTGHAAGVSFSEIVNFETTQGSDQTVTVDYGVHHANGSYTAGTGATKRNCSWTSAVNSGVYLDSVGEHPSSVNFRFYEPGTEAGATAIAAQNTHVSRDDADQARLQRIDSVYGAARFVNEHLYVVIAVGFVLLVLAVTILFGMMSRLKARFSRKSERSQITDTGAEPAQRAASA